MKKIALLSLVVITVALLGSCASWDSRDLPEFVKNPPVVSDGFYGVGYAKQANLQLSIKVAETRARSDIANQIGVTIQEIVQLYSQESGVGNDTQVLEFAEIVTRQVTDQIVEGAVMVSRHPMNDGGVWVLAKYDTNRFKEVISEAVQQTAETFSRTEEAAFTEWKAEKAFDYMNDILKNNPTQSSPVTED